jgi:hypothetical protein
MKLDRTMQLEILEQLAAACPQQINLTGERVAGDPLTLNAWYLHQHGLIEALIAENIGAPPVVIGGRITAQGMDFLADDGGLSAILGVVTIKIHEDTLKALLADKIEQSDLPPADKGLWLQALQALPAESTKHLVTKLLDWGLANPPRPG